MKTIEIKDSKLCLPMEEIIAVMDMDQKREVLAWLATDHEVIESVVSHLTGTDDLGWSTGDANMRQRMLSKVEETQVAELRYNWKPWDEIRQKIKDIRSTEHLYWVLYHKIDKSISGPLFEELRRLGVESNYTTKEGDEDVATLNGLIKSTFAEMTPTPNQ